MLLFVTGTLTTWEVFNDNVLLKSTNISTGEHVNTFSNISIDYPFSVGSDHFNDHVSFTTEGVLYHGFMGNDSFFIFHDDLQQRKSLYHSRWPYPNGAQAKHIAQTRDDRILYIVFRLHPWVLRMDVSTSSFRSSLPYMNERFRLVQDLIVTYGHDYNQELMDFVAYISNDMQSIFVSSLAAGEEPYEQTTQDTPCSSFNSLYPFPSDGGLIRFIVDCSNSAGNRKRYTAKFDVEMEVINGFTEIPQSMGTPLSSLNGDFVVVTSTDGEGGLYSIDLYDSTDFTRFGRMRSRTQPEHVSFVRQGNTTWLSLYRVQRNLTLINPTVFIKSNGRDGVFEIPNLVISSTWIPIQSVGDTYLMLGVYNPSSTYYDYVYLDENFTVNRIQRVSQKPSNFIFLESEPPPSPAPPPPPSTSSVKTTTPSPPTPTATVTNSPTSSTDLLAVYIAVPIITFILAVILFITIYKVVTECRKRSTSIEDGIEEKVTCREGKDEMALTTDTTQKKPQKESDEGYYTPSPSLGGHCNTITYQAGIQESSSASSSNSNLSHV